MLPATSSNNINIPFKTNNGHGLIKWIIAFITISYCSSTILVQAQTQTESSTPSPAAEHDLIIDPDTIDDHFEQFQKSTQADSKSRELDEDLKIWLKDNGLDQWSNFFRQIGVVTLVSIVQLDILTQDKIERNNLEAQNTGSELYPLNIYINSIPTQDQIRLKRASVILRKRLILRLWLEDFNLLEYAAQLNSLGVNSIEDAYWFENNAKLKDLVGEKILSIWLNARHTLPTKLESLENLKSNIWNRIVHLNQISSWNTWGTMLLVTLSVSGFGAVAAAFPQVLDPKHLMQYVSGKFSLANNCKIEFDWHDPITVGQTVSFNLRFFQRGGRSYPICDKDNVFIEVKTESQKVAIVTEYGGNGQESDANLINVKFSVRKSGQYSVHVMVENNHISGSPFQKTFLPGPIDPKKSIFIRQTSTFVCVASNPHKLIIEPRDQFGNCCRPQDVKLELFNFIAERIEETNLCPETATILNASVQFTHEVQPISTNNTNNNQGNVITHHSLIPSSNTVHQIQTGRVILTLRFPEPGVFHGVCFYDKKNVQNGIFDIISLNSTEANSVQKNILTKSPNSYYEAKLLQIGNNVQNKVRKVYVTISSKQFIIKEYYFKLVPIRVATFRIQPNTKLKFLVAKNQNEFPTISIEDGSQPGIKLELKDAKIVVSTFTHFLLRNIGGSETFQDKQDHFFKELRELHRKHPRDKQILKIARENIIESTWKAVKNLSDVDWCRNFEISFIGEPGIDWGGVRREWFEMLCSKLFESGNPVGLFHSFGDSRLVHINPNSRWKLKHYEMAGRIVGKCLFESSLGSTFRQMVKARLSRSFLAQLIGLRVNYKHFQQDDPELYLRKVKFILENDVEGMDLTFSEEEYDPMGKLVKVVDLIPDGSKVTVTNENKREYLNALAQYRLSTKVKAELEAFLKGLNSIIPDELLSIFDENELELLMCGTSVYSVMDLRENHIVTCCGSMVEFRKTLDWFFTCVGNMTEEEKARLLQFVTGCSLLPPGGFKNLSPLFQISPSPNFLSNNSLPQSHTCFNSIILPDYDNYEKFEKSIRLAINEGSEGFGLI